MEFSSDTVKKVKAKKKFIEKKLKVKIDIKGNDIDLKGKTEDVFIGEKVCQALDRNFPIRIALLLLDENYILEDIPIKSIREKHIKETKARIIGTKGKTLKTLSELSNCYITLHNNTVSILGPTGTIKEACTAITNLIRGSKQANVYKYLEKRKKLGEEDLGLKE